MDWLDPEVEEVAPGVHRMPLPLPMDGLRGVNVYVLETESGLTLIDGGWAIPASRKAFDAGLASLGYTARDVRRFLVTHMHRDHYTQAVAVRREVGSHVALGWEEHHTLDLMHGELTEDPALSRLRACGAEHLALAYRKLMPAEKPAMDDYAMPDEWLREDQQIALPGRVLSAVATPGHTRGHFVFADEAAGLLFAGDHVLPTITPSIGFEPAFTQQPLRDFLGSLAKVRALPDARLLPAHGPIAASVHARVDELIAHHHHRLEQCRMAVLAGASTAWEVAAHVPWTSRGRTRDELGPFDVVLAAFETLAHLELLAAQGDVSRSVAGEVIVFGPARRL